MTQKFASIFSNCSEHYAWEVIFDFCPNATNPCRSIQQIETAVHIAYADYYTTVVLFSIAGIMNIYCLLVLIPLYRRMQNDSKKKYIFLISRCISGLLAANAWLLIQCIYLRFISPNPNNFPYYVLALALNISSTYGLLGSYVGMAGILYLGVLNPIAFNQHLTLRVVYVEVALVALVSICLAELGCLLGDGDRVNRCRGEVGAGSGDRGEDRVDEGLGGRSRGGDGVMVVEQWWAWRRKIRGHLAGIGDFILESSGTILNEPASQLIHQIGEHDHLLVENQIIRVPFSILEAAIAIPTKHIKCSTKTCAPLMATLNFVLVFGSLVIASLTLLFVLISLFRHRKQFNKLDTVSNTSLDSAIRLLSWTLFTVILVLMAEIIPFVFMEIKKHRGPKPGCYWFDHADTIVGQVTWAMVESSLWSIALIIDPITNIILDRNVSKQARRQIKWIQTKISQLIQFFSGKFSKRKNIEEESQNENEQEQEQITELELITSIIE